MDGAEAAGGFVAGAEFVAAVVVEDAHAARTRQLTAIVSAGAVWPKGGRMQFRRDAAATGSMVRG
jgi:hypothetical protein